jgi:protein-tyrosine phosphatase
MIETARQNDIDISELAARQFVPKDFEYFDKIVVMDAANYRDVIRLAQDEDHKNKVVFALAENKDVPDPYFGGKEGFETVYQLLHNACQQILDSIEKR